ncbi:aquaporin family protein [Streptomyces sp. NA02950]|uniref:MIP/aquaporin family protein n=1 Tax=Streptomyces sp. NA02950 TaxID=2742137 RepID=UPI0015912615|nr:MIP/aquaporin family protein [Streptomyces sp. NA02950]QKV96220.1 aquaporin family protein [Streptomyces sp. NA02950]
MRITENSLLQKLLAEFIGTAFLVFLGVGSIPVTLILEKTGKTSFTMADLGVIAFAFAMAVVATVFTIGHISGCHINPAVTLALAATGAIGRRDAAGYVLAQCAGAVAGAAAIVGVLGSRAVHLGLGIASYTSPTTVPQAFMAEAVGTLILVFVVFGVIDRRAPSGFAGLPIGFAVFAIAVVLGPVTGAALNPARSLGPELVSALHGRAPEWSQLPVYLGAQVTGGLLAGWLYRMVGRVRTIAV